MSDYFDEVELNDEDEFVDPEQNLAEESVRADAVEKMPVFTDSPRKRLEQLMEERRLRDELEDFLDI